MQPTNIFRTWADNSLVGERISAEGHAVRDPSRRGLLGPGPFTIRAMIGKQKAAVFPDPVWAQAIKSLPAISTGIAYRCTGVGFTYPHRLTFPFSEEHPRSMSQNAPSIGGGAFDPAHLDRDVIVGVEVDSGGEVHVGELLRDRVQRVGLDGAAGPEGGTGGGGGDGGLVADVRRDVGRTSWANRRSYGHWRLGFDD
ncbi:hypothetical protein QJS10_CPB22g01149 [Acorus calamus]|uniref:Uncharacterized protein n=1 Tax=Acorus calamus TaxID=4465 RepID=A0AAV9BYV7_ACOCL|nr:hypothetical protein QJS10_CPB22g01149 [Acorus calamus]